jgi:hypothetical protein
MAVEVAPRPTLKPNSPNALLRVHQRMAQHRSHELLCKVARAKMLSVAEDVGGGMATVAWRGGGTGDDGRCAPKGACVCGVWLCFAR